MPNLRDDTGFTLIEVLIAVSILGVIVLALGAAFGVGVRGLDSTSNRLVSSNDAQFVSNYFPPDVQNASSGSTSGISCSDAGTSNSKILLRWPVSDAGAARTIVYWVKDTGRGTYELVRSAWDKPDCNGTPVQSTVVARNVAGASDADVEADPVTDGFKIRVRTKPAATDSNQYEFTVTGKMRVPA
jgi:prepilin-type N-terminal cleavage/methylation domain-containing protein